MNTSLRKGLTDLFRSVSKTERKRNPSLEAQATKILMTLSEIRSLERQRDLEATRYRAYVEDNGGSHPCN